MNLSKCRSFGAKLLGMGYRELPDTDLTLRKAIKQVLADFGAVKYRESGTAAYEVNNEYFRISRQKLRICTEDHMFVSLWGPKLLVDEISAEILKRLEKDKTKA